MLEHLFFVDSNHAVVNSSAGRKKMALYTEGEGMATAQTLEMNLSSDDPVQKKKGITQLKEIVDQHSPELAMKVPSLIFHVGLCSNVSGRTIDTVGLVRCNYSNRVAS